MNDPNTKQKRFRAKIFNIQRAIWREFTCSCFHALLISQIISIGEGIRDAAYFITQSCQSYHRREREQEVVRAYWEALVAGGVSPICIVVAWKWCSISYRNDVWVVGYNL
jgi:hypothetical protein